MPNDPPFPEPVTVVDFDGVELFELGFEAYGFNGVAGYDFSEADLAGVNFSIDQGASGSLAWIADGQGWGTGEAITFFWQSTQAPAGPGGLYSISNPTGSGAGAGPVPVATVVPEPLMPTLLITGLAAMALRRMIG
ncbi:hypothetical protein GCM10022278_18290 [Allohahella marinimesophila]|uniref:PEP-CTERM sorting domain-containing protein n=2 Tax=Allohahella marinimesophila TaxID=1054972 RepID=A0ABP7P6R2_9GAMM